MGLNIIDHRLSNFACGQIRSRVKALSASPGFGPALLFNVLKICRQCISFRHGHNKFLVEQLASVDLIFITSVIHIHFALRQNASSWLGVIHKGRPHRRGGGEVKPNTDKSGQRGRGSSVQADVRIYTTCRPRIQCYNTGLQALHPVYSPGNVQVSVAPAPTHPHDDLSVHSVAAARCLPAV